MNSLARISACVGLAVAAVVGADAVAAVDPQARSAQWAEAADRQAEAMQRRQRPARLRWDYERRRSGAPARMANTLYASTPTSQATRELSCPVMADEGVRRNYRKLPDDAGGGSRAFIHTFSETGRASHKSNVNVFSAVRRETAPAPPRSSGPLAKDAATGHPIQASGWNAATAGSGSAATVSQDVHLFPSASEPLREGFVRIINHSSQAGEVTIDPTDDSGRSYDTLTLSIAASETKHFNSLDLENGNEDKGLTGSTGSGQGHWRLEFSSNLDIEVLSYIRTDDGFLTAMHDLAPGQPGFWRVSMFNPGNNSEQRSLLRLINEDDASADVTITGFDGAGLSPGSDVRLSIRAGAARTLSAQELESGGENMHGALGDGIGKWQLEVESDKDLAVVGLLASPTGSLTNLSTAPFRGAGTNGRPMILDPGSIGTERDIWAGEVEHGRVAQKFAADFDGDGDDDMVLPGASYEPTGEDAGVILINDGDFTFTIDKGDRPWGQHPREVVMADFDGDGMNDFFIADTGYDRHPFNGWPNKLLLWTAEGYRDASNRLPDVPNGYSHNAAAGDVDGDGDTDIFVADSGVNENGPYFLLNEGNARFVADRSPLPDSFEEHNGLFAWAAELADLDGDGHVDLIGGATAEPPGESSVYWGSGAGEYTDNNRTVLRTPGFWIGYGRAEVISIAVFDCNGDGRPDLLLGGYDHPALDRRGVQLLVNRGNREFVDETSRRIGPSAWSPDEGWHVEHKFLDFNGDGTIDIVPNEYHPERPSGGSNVLAWLNDGTGHYVALKTEEFPHADDYFALWDFAAGTKVRVGTKFKSMTFIHGSNDLATRAAVVLTGATIALVD